MGRYDHMYTLHRLPLLLQPTPLPQHHPKNMNQLREVQEAGSLRTHFANPWNVVEIFTLVSMSVGAVFRVWAFTCDGEGRWLCGEASGVSDSSSVSEINEVYLAQYFQAASAPLVLGRLLFLTQVRGMLLFWCTKQVEKGTAF